MLLTGLVAALFFGALIALVYSVGGSARTAVAQYEKQVRDVADVSLYEIFIFIKCIAKSQNLCFTSKALQIKECHFTVPAIESLHNSCDHATHNNGIFLGKFLFLTKGNGCELFQVFSML